MLRNKGDGTFEDVAKQSGALAISGGMSASFGDYDGDGRLDIYVSSIASNQRWFSHDLNVRGYVLSLVESDRRNDLQPLFLDLRAHLGNEALRTCAVESNVLHRQKRCEGYPFRVLPRQTNSQPDRDHPQ